MLTSRFFKEFWGWSNLANIQPVTRQNDPLAANGELSFKCSIPCPATSSKCETVAALTNVLWYSNSSFIYNSSLIYNANERKLFSFLPESEWTNYINNEVNMNN